MFSFKKSITVCSTSILMICLLAGCISNSADKTIAPNVKKVSNNISQQQITLTYWTAMGAKASLAAPNLSQTPLFQELAKRTNVTVKFKHPPQGHDTEQFNIMIAARDLPDIIETDWSQYPGTEKKAAEDNILLELTDLVDKHAPNYKKFLDTQIPQAKKWVTTENKYYIFPSLSSNKNYIVTVGPIMRKDLLDKYNLQVPTTIDEWENVLRTFKENGIKYPLTYLDTESGRMIKGWFAFVGSFGVARTFYQDNGKIKFGYMEQGMKDYLTLTNRWIKEGLIDPDVATMDSKAFNSKILNGEVGAFLGSIGDIQTNLTVMKTSFPDVELIGVPYPSLKKGELCRFLPNDRVEGYTYNNAIGITTANKFPAETIKFLDYAYSDEGHMLYNFGIEGLSYKMDNGYPKFTDTITKSPDGLTMMQVLNRYTRSSMGYVDERAMDQVYNLPQQHAATATWSENASKVKQAVVWKARYKMTADESKEFNKIMININTFTEEQYTKFLLGIEPLENYDRFTAQLQKMGIERAIEIVQGAYDRVMK